MKVHTVQSGCVSLTLEYEPDMQEALDAVNEALAEIGQSPWPGAEISLFCGRGEYLLLAAPYYNGSVKVSQYALEYLCDRLAGLEE